MKSESTVTIQDVFNKFYLEYEKHHKLSAVQRKAAYHIRKCKTGAFGVNISVCEDCGCISVHYNSCRDRCCPMCQEFPKEKWVDARRIYSNQKLLYDALYHASSDTLRELASDSKYLGADIGYICILHTWGSEMNFHPHIHAVVLGGGLDPKNHWKDNGEDFFLPIRVVSRLFRGKYLAELKNLWEDGKLEFHGKAECFNTHRIAISNYRIKSITDSTVTFTAKDYKNQGQWKEVTITGEEFIRRFLMHVPPKRFVRIRHYGLLSSRNKNRKITLCRNLLGCKKYLSRLKDLDAAAIIRLLYNKDVCKCSSCGGRIIPIGADPSLFKPEPHLLC